MPLRRRPSGSSDEPCRVAGLRRRPGWPPRSRRSRRRPAPRRAARAQCARSAWMGLRRARLWLSWSSFAEIADLALAFFRIGRGGAFTPLVLPHHGRAPAGIGWLLAARLHEVGGVLDHRSEVALAGAAEVP